MINYDLLPNDKFVQIRLPKALYDDYKATLKSDFCSTSVSNELRRYMKKTISKQQDMDI